MCEQGLPCVSDGPVAIGTIEAVRDLSPEGSQAGKSGSERSLSEDSCGIHGTTLTVVEEHIDKIVVVLFFATNPQRGGLCKEITPESGDANWNRNDAPVGQGSVLRNIVQLAKPGWDSPATKVARRARQA